MAACTKTRAGEEKDALGNVGVDITPGYMHCEATPIKPLLYTLLGKTLWQLRDSPNWE